MSVHTLNSWVLVKQIDEHGNVSVRIYDSIKGGFTNGDLWKLSSAVAKVVQLRSDEDQRLTRWYSFHTANSEYLGWLGAHGMTTYTAGIFKQLSEDAESHGFRWEVMDAAETKEWVEKWAEPEKRAEES